MGMTQRHSQVFISDNTFFFDGIPEPSTRAFTRLGKLCFPLLVKDALLVLARIVYSQPASNSPHSPHASIRCPSSTLPAAQARHLDYGVPVNLVAR